MYGAPLYSAVCPVYEEYLECGPGCQRTCDNTTIASCALIPCRKGCFCKPGYIRGPDGKCILPQQCPMGKKKIPIDSFT